MTPTTATIFTPEEVFSCVKKHVGCDWGDISADDRKANDVAAYTGDRLVSRYRVRGHELLIITEADRSATTIMLPEEY